MPSPLHYKQTNHTNVVLLLLLLLVLLLLIVIIMIIIMILILMMIIHMIIMMIILQHNNSNDHTGNADNTRDLLIAPSGLLGSQSEVRPEKLSPISLTYTCIYIYI